MKPSLGTMSVKPIIEHKGSPWHSVPYATYAFNAKQSESTIKLKYGDLEILLKDGKFQFISKGGAIISNIKEIIFMNSKIRGITDDITSIPPEEQRYYALNAFPKILKIGKYDLNESFITNFLNDISNKVDKVVYENEVKQINDELNTKASVEYVNEELMKKVDVSVYESDKAKINDELMNKAEKNHTHTGLDTVSINEINPWFYESGGAPIYKPPTFTAGLITNDEITYMKPNTEERTYVIEELMNKVDKLTFENEVKQINDELNTKAEKNHTHPYFELLRVDKLLIINHLRIRNHNILEFIYPIGSIYTSMNNTNPYDLFQFGVWSQITDRFLYCANSSKQEGGSKKITVENLPQHNHNCMWQDINSGGFKAGRVAEGNKWSTELVFDNKNSFIHTDDNPEFKNTDYMPPYITVYAWYREA